MPAPPVRPLATPAPPVRPLATPQPPVRLLAALCAGVALAGCGGNGRTQTAAPPKAPAGIALASPAFAPGGQIPRAYTCDGRDISPPLRWGTAPRGTTELTLRMEDPDAPGGTFTHWSVDGISPTATAVAAGQTPRGGRPGRNGFGTLGYRGPCPPRGDPPHHYVIRISALAGRRLLAAGTLVGTYARR